MITQGKHLESKGVKKIRKISKSMEKFNSSYGDMYKISPTGAEPPLTLLNFPSPLVVAIIGGFFLDSFSFMYNYFPLLCAADYSTLVMTGIDINFTLCLSPLVVLPKGLLPIKIYVNADVEKLDIYKQNKGKSGIYI